MTVAGRIVDAATGAAVPFATVTVLRDGVAVGGELADDSGRFAIEGLERGSYVVSAGFVGQASRPTRRCSSASGTITTTSAM